MSNRLISSGLVHQIPPDLRIALSADTMALTAWNSLTALARNEWICWVISVKQATTRQEHIKRLIDDLREGVRRPCCWLGCIHRTDKAISPSVRAILNKRSKKK